MRILYIGFRGVKRNLTQELAPKYCPAWLASPLPEGEGRRREPVMQRKRMTNIEKGFIPPKAG